MRRRLAPTLLVWSAPPWIHSLAGWCLTHDLRAAKRVAHASYRRRSGLRPDNCCDGFPSHLTWSPRVDGALLWRSPLGDTELTESLDPLSRRSLRGAASPACDGPALYLANLSAAPASSRLGCISTALRSSLPLDRDWSLSDTRSALLRNASPPIGGPALYRPPCGSSASSRLAVSLQSALTSAEAGVALLRSLGGSRSSLPEPCGLVQSVRITGRLRGLP